MPNFLLLVARIVNKTDVGILIMSEYTYSSSKHSILTDRQWMILDSHAELHLV